MFDKKHVHGDTLEKLIRNVEAIDGNGYFIDPGKELGIPHSKLTLMALGYALKTNTLITGEPGFGKTTGAKVVLSAFSSLPFDLYESLQIEGNPDITRSELIGRPDFHRLGLSSRDGGGEFSIWNKAAYLPGVLFDEMNRVPEGKNSMILTAVETGRFNSGLGHTLYSGDSLPFYGTMNYEDEGTRGMIPPLLDRFQISLEFGYLGPFHQDSIDGSKEKRKEISDPELVSRLMNALNSRDTEDKGKFEEVKRVQEEYSQTLQKLEIHPFLDGERDDLANRIRRVEFSTEALILLDCIAAEMNFTPLYGLKRRSDPVDISTHSGPSGTAVRTSENPTPEELQASTGLSEPYIASSNVKNSLSPRAIKAIKLYSQALALLRKYGETKEDRIRVEKEDIASIASYVLAHRLEPTEDFKAMYAAQRRITEGAQNHELAYRLIMGIERNYATVHQDLALLQNYIDPKKRRELNHEQQTRAREILSTPADRIDHPLVRHYIKSYA